ncbi:CdaR family transcriptional regulator [Microbacterium sp. SORGH_AS_0888]|uniref:PucR family transcriptional regulator n=1 Tax=Microbacterium sp. SORGH_AS_0888 TaxID=3041791 RepID=UPI00278B3AD9|nr:helix-turn-helix domain-containing protein [Microbacterium sp. SORGH_AS_0888]MDQ1129530.1 DNA-binding PucR family transcriptional regulator [Microbacterium sp. SORGH_AS_0888]
MSSGSVRGATDELLRNTAKVFLTDPTVIRPIREAVADATDRRFGSDPAISEAIGEAAWANTQHWARSMYDDPQRDVEPHLTSQVVGIARDGYRWGEEATLRASYRAGERATWSLWMTIAFSLCDDPDVLLPALERASRSLSLWIEATVSALIEVLEQERATLSADQQVRRLELVNLILGGAPAPPAGMDRRLGYPLRAAHLGVIVWAPAQVADREALVRAADRLGRVAESRNQLLVQASASSLWLWLTPGVPVPPEAIETALAPYRDVRLAIGSLDEGVDGFRRTHDRALETQRLMQTHNAHPIGFYDDVAAVLVMARDDARLREFIHAVLGPLALAPQELRDTLRTFIHQRYNASRTAELLFTHRNTVLQRVRRAQSRLPVSLERHGTNVGLALDAMHWLNLPQP